MRKLSNGWHVPDTDIKMTEHVVNDKSMSAPEYEDRHRRTILKHIPQRKTFVDVGANIGIWSMSMRSTFDYVVSFEPSVLNRECLELNLGKDSDIRPYAVGSEPGKANFRDAKNNCGDSKIVLEERSNMYEVDVVRLDDQNITNCSLIKIDVQGYEWPVVLGAQNIIETQHPWIIFEINEEVDIICKFLEERNYEMIQNKSKRVMIWAPKEGDMAPKDPTAWGRNLGPGPYLQFTKRG
jgi:FkbM family methyltransferase